ncbi:hypothetical protein KRX11_10275 [Pasteurellaceae bacterium TAE3-ERU1]|nr:hypothetical protein [Pasteurellaceae bacterium TAE3-ERU1]
MTEVIYFFKPKKSNLDRSLLKVGDLVKVHSHNNSSWQFGSCSTCKVVKIKNNSIVIEILKDIPANWRVVDIDRDNKGQVISVALEKNESSTYEIPIDYIICADHP